MSRFSDFFHYATPEEREKVFNDVIDKSIAKQKQLMEKDMDWDKELLRAEIVDLERACKAMANALQDIFNDVGNMTEVRKGYESVSAFVDQHKD